jgi:ankyrin repeat protein
VTVGDRPTFWRSLRDLARAAAPLPLLNLPAELLKFILNLLDIPSQLSLIQTCTHTRNSCTEEHRKWLIFAKNCLALLTQNPEQRTDELRVVEKCYQIILSRLLCDNISDKMCEETASLAEKFFRHLSRNTIKGCLNDVLSKQPPACNWQAIFEKLARHNLHLCLTLITLASPNFDPNKDNQVCIRLGRLRYPFTEYYPYLASKLSFDKAQATQLPKRGAYAADNITLDSAQAQNFFRQLRQEHAHNTVLHFAVMEGYINIVPALVQNHRCIDLPNEHGRTALISACVQKHYKTYPERYVEIDYIKTIQTLLELNANPDLQDYNGNTALMYMCLQNDLEVIRLLLKYRANSELHNKAGTTALLYAARADLTNRAETVRLLLAHGANVHWQDNLGETALFYASQPKTVRLLLKYGARVNHQNANQTTALMRACHTKMTDSDQQHYFAIAELLLKHGAQINLSDKQGLTALMYASQKNNLPIIKLLLTYHPDIDLQDKQGLTAFMYACQEEHTEAARLLVLHGAKMDLQDRQGLTALIHASQKGHIETLQFLLTLNVKTDQQSRDQNTALLYACTREGNEMVVQALLVEAHADPNLRDNQGMTPLMHAIQTGNIGAVRLLLAHGAKIDQPDTHGLTALMHASEKGQFEAVSLLLNQGHYQSAENLQKDMLASFNIVQARLQQNKNKTSGHTLALALLRQYEHIATKLENYLSKNTPNLLTERSPVH